MHHSPCIAVSLLLALTPVGLHAQAGKNMLSNGGFERSSINDNIWDGVDSGGYLTGGKFSVKALSEAGISGLAMPVSVAFLDMNADGKPDIFTADPMGYFRLYLNSGTPKDPKFTQGEIVPVYISRFQWGRRKTPTLMRDRWRVPKVSFADWTGTGKLDMLVGVYSGELFVLPNRGSANRPAFDQPRSIPSAMLKTTVDGKLWGNLFSPLTYDWNGDGRPDLLIGDGSYSANAVHLLINEGSGNAPKFTAQGRYYLAYGDGREHLHPSVVDYNGDGKPDLLVADRKGQVSAYLNTNAGKWNPEDELKFTSAVTFGGSSPAGGITSLATGDYNGDGLFDILMGKANGHVAVAVNTGTKSEPKFGPATEIKGVDLWKRDIRLPSGWELANGDFRGNYNMNFTCVSKEEDANAAPPEGKYALKAYYNKPLNQVFEAKMITEETTIKSTAEEDEAIGADYYVYDHGSTQTVALSTTVPKLETGKSYQVSFRHKGNGVRNAAMNISANGFIKVMPTKVERGDRGLSDVKRFEVRDKVSESADFSPGASWGTITKTFNVKFSKRELKDKNPSSTTILFTFELANWDSVLYLDDVQVVEK